jgi:hypothetical protein
VARDARAPELARRAVALAAGADIELPPSLQLWWLAGGRPGGVATEPALDPARTLGQALEGRLTDVERRRGAHYTPDDLAASVAAHALPTVCARPVVDPACGGGALLLAAADRLVGLGADRATVARHLLWGADVDPLATAVTEAAIALWSGGIPPVDGHMVVGDALLGDARLWPSPPIGGFGAVVANPPFQGQLARATTRGSAHQAAVRRRFGPAVAPYVDTAALFLLAGVDLAATGARVVMVQPQSSAGARDAAAVRELLGRRAGLVDLLVPDEQPFAANVDVCVPVLEVGDHDDHSSWTARLAQARGVPPLGPIDGPTVGSLAGAVAGFRQHYYGLVGHVREGEPASDGADDRRLVTCGAIDVGATTWGRVPTRFARQAWCRPVVDLVSLADEHPSVADWVERLRRPKVLVASQTRVVEAVVDREGHWVPGVPVVAVVPDDPADVDRLAAVLCAPPVAALAAARATGTGLSAGSIRMSSSLAVDLPLPVDRGAWDEAAGHLEAGRLDAFADVATAMYALPVDDAAAVTRWWHRERPARS